LEFKDYYATLGVKKDASQDEIQKAYRKLARKHHPDVNKDPASEARFKEIGEANEVLKDPEKRKRYDMYGSARNSARQTGAPPPGLEGVRFDFGGPGGSSGFDFDEGPGGFSSFFDMLFGGGAGRGGRGAGFGGFGGFGGANGPGGPGAMGREGSDSEATLPLTLEESAHGGTREISLVDPETGERKNLSVKIPAGVRSGQRIRLAGQGTRGRGGAAGNLLLKVEILPHPRFKVEGNDLQTTVNVAPWEAALGGEASLAPLNGEVTIKIPAGSSSGRKIRLRGKGLKPSGGEPGDLIAEIRVVVPPELTPRERELFEELRAESSFKARP